MNKQEIYSELLRINEMSLQLEPKKALLDLMSRMCEGGLESENENRCFLPILAPQHLIGTLKIYIEPSLLCRTEPAPHQEKSYIHIITLLNRLKSRQEKLQNEIQALEAHLPEALKQRHQ